MTIGNNDITRPSKPDDNKKHFQEAYTRLLILMTRCLNVCFVRSALCISAAWCREFLDNLSKRVKRWQGRSQT